MSDGAEGAGTKGAEKVEEVNLDEIEDEPAHNAKPAAAAGSTTVEEVKPEELAQKIPIPEYDTTPWLLWGPMLVALLLMWNVDWKDARARSETAARRLKKQLPQRKSA